MSQKIAGCVVLYNPGEVLLGHMDSYIDGLSVLILIDNSPLPDKMLAEKIRLAFPGVVYQWMGENKGIAKALNVAAEIAISHSCKWLLTMDQDSRFQKNELLSFIDSIDEVITRHPRAAIISPSHDVHEQINSRGAAEFQVIRTAMTSGNLLNLDVFTAVGGFAEKLFIDFVDHEYCLRVREKGYLIVRNNNVTLQHSLGRFEVKSILGLKIGISNHNYRRRYYITRNGVFTIRKYIFFDPIFCWKIISSIVGDAIRILFFERRKASKFKAIARGFWHALINKFGKYE